MATPARLRPTPPDRDAPARRPGWRLLAGVAGVVAVLVVAAVACGARDPSPLERAERAMAELEAGRMELQLSAIAGAEDRTGPVGFRLEGPFSYTGGGALPVLDLRYTRLLGAETEVREVVSTGEAVYVVAGGKVAEVPEAEAARLRLGSGDGGVADLGIAGWVRDPQVEERPDGTRVVRGPARVADLLSDLARITDQLGGVEGKAPEGDAADRLERLVRASEVVVEVGGDDLPRSVRALVDFGGSVPDDLRRALGPYASPRFELTVSLSPLEGPLVVERP